MTGEQHIPVWWMLSDKLRGIEAVQAELLRSQQDHNQKHGQKIARLAESNVKLSDSVSQIGSQVAIVAQQMELIISWGRRILLALGLALLSSQHLTIDQAARLIKAALGI